MQDEDGAESRRGSKPRRRQRPLRSIAARPEALGRAVAAREPTTVYGGRTVGSAAGAYDNEVEVLWASTATALDEVTANMRAAAVILEQLEAVVDRVGRPANGDGRPLGPVDRDAHAR